MGRQAQAKDNVLMELTQTSPCPCGSNLRFADCCHPLHQGVAAADAQALMRSRYSAYVARDSAYLLRSWHASTRPAALSLEETPGQRTQWLGLTIKQHRVTGPDTAEVIFLARYRVGGGSAVRMIEHSRFVREDGHWYYLDALE